MEILLVPNELLRQKANRLINITSEDIKIANQMMDTMIKAPGVGLAANQVGILKQIITINFRRIVASLRHLQAENQTPGPETQDVHHHHGQFSS